MRHNVKQWALVWYDTHGSVNSSPYLMAHVRDYTDRFNTATRDYTSYFTRTSKEDVDICKAMAADRNMAILHAKSKDILIRKVAGLILKNELQGVYSDNEFWGEREKAKRPN